MIVVIIKRLNEYLRKAKLYHVFESCIFGKGIPDTLTIFVHLTTYTLRTQNCANLFFTLTTTQIQSTTMYASAYIQVSNLKIKPSKTKDAKKKKKKNGGHGGRSRVQCNQCYLYRNEIYTHYTHSRRGKMLYTNLPNNLTAYWKWLDISIDLSKREKVIIITNRS